MVMFPEYMVQQMADSEPVIPIGACIEASGFDTSPFLPRALLAYETEGVQWSMPFNVSDPVLYYNTHGLRGGRPRPRRPAGVARGAAGDVAGDRRHAARRARASPSTRASTPAAAGSSSSGSPGPASSYADNGNGRLAPATQVLYAGAGRRRR